MGQRITIKPEDYWRKVDRRGANECWPWTGSVSPSGTGTVFFDDKPQSASRFFYELMVGKIPKSKVMVLGCGMKHCCNIRHMKVVSRSEAMAIHKKLFPEKWKYRPMNCLNRKLDHKKAAKIRELYAKGNTTYQALGEKYGVDHRVINGIVKGTRWKIDDV